MSLIAAVHTNPEDTETSADADVLRRLRGVCGARGLDGLAARLADLSGLVRWDMASLEEALASLPRGDSAVMRGAHHLLDAGGKRLRPMCVALASRLGTGFDERARSLAVAVELVHAATLLHDDVVDLGEVRRGAPAARLIYGNATSIFAGDWLLIHALTLVRRSRVPGVLEHLLDIVAEMILAESIQLENRGHVRTSRETYFRVVEGKTAALFRWAMFAGARAGGLRDEACRALEEYGLHLGVAFQLVDDLLDYTGEASATGKELFQDLREGKMTYPLIEAIERDPSLRELLSRISEHPKSPLDPAVSRRLLLAFTATEVVDRCRALASRRANDAIRCVSGLPDSPAKAALLTVAEATAHREA